MPLAVESLTPESNDKTVQDAISDSMSTCMKEGGRTQKECAGMIYDMAEEAIGHEIPYRSQK